MIAVSLNNGGGIRLIKPAKLYMCGQKHYKYNEDECMETDVPGHDSILLSHLGNVITRIGLQHGKVEFQDNLRLISFFLMYLGISACFSVIFTNGDNFNDFLFSHLDNTPFHNSIYS